MTTAVQRELERVSRLYAGLRRISQAIVQATTRDQLFQRACEILVEEAGFGLAWVGWQTPPSPRLTAVASFGAARDYVARIAVYTDDRAEGSGPAGVAFRENRPCVSNDFLADPAAAPWREDARLGGLRSAAGLPISQDGAVRGVLVVYAETIEHFQDKELALLVEVVSDVSFALDHLRREGRLREREARLAEAQRIAHLGSWVFDLEQRTLAWSDEIYRIFAVTPVGGGASYEQFIAAVHPDDLARLQAAQHRAERDEERLDLEHRIIRPDGTIRWVHEVAELERDAMGRPTKLSGTVLDITERREAQALLVQANAELERKVVERTAELQAALVRAEAADKLKSAFLATMSHELRTPLTSILGFTGLLLQGAAGPLSAEQTTQLGMVRSSARHLHELINDVLDLSKIEAEQLEVRREPFDLRAVLAHTLAVVKPHADRKQLALSAVLGSTLGEMVSDRRRVEQIVLNLLNNAVKFTERGGVVLAAEVVSDARVRISVTDTGVGVKAEDLGMLFQPFRQLDTTVQSHREGTGLGLAICRRLAALLGGEVSVTSEWGTGSVFAVVLPIGARS